MEIAFIINKKHFAVEEVDFEKLSKYTNNFIIEYDYNDNSYFRRSLFELDRLGLNIGISIDLPNIDYNILNDLLNNIKGFNINIGVWYTPIDEYNNIYGKLNEFVFNFIYGIKSNTNLPIPVWKENGDIEDGDVIVIDGMKEPINTVYLNTDYKSIYKENNFKPIPSTYKF